MQPGVLSMGVLFAVAAGIQESGVVDLCMRSILGNPSTVFAAQMRLVPSTFSSAAAAASLLPLSAAAASLLPLSTAAASSLLLLLCSRFLLLFCSVCYQEMFVAYFL